MTRLLALMTCILMGTSPTFADTSATPLEDEVAAVESAFAKTMADRDFDAFAEFLDDDAIFASGAAPLRGKEQVMAAWKALYEGEDAPFSWKPETVIALPSGGLAMSTGPVMAPDGQITAYYTSTWRQDEEGNWKIIFDKGQAYCSPPEKDAE